MKVLKRIGLGIVSLLVIIVIVLVAAVLIDGKRTNYLLVRNQPKSALNSYLITNVNIIPMTADTVLQNQRIKIIDGIIHSIGPNIEADGLEVFDGKGAYISPGLIDMHVHVWDNYELGLYLANGITTVRNVWGQPMHLRMKKEVASGEMIAPLFFTSGPKLTGPDYYGNDNLQLYDTDEAKAKITEYKQRGYDFIKTYNGLTEDLFTAILEQCRKEGLDIVAHPSAEVPYAFHFDPQIKSIEHVEDVVQQPLAYQLDTAKLDEVIALYTSHPNAALCPTAVVYYNIYRLLTEGNVLENGELDYINPLIRRLDSKAQYERWQRTKAANSGIETAIKKQHDFHLYILQKLHENGVTLLCGTDAGIGVTPPGISIHQELSFYTQAGLSNYEALKTATVNPTAIHEFLANMGTIEPGKLANFIVTSTNPLVNLGTLKDPQTVFINGRKLDQQTLDDFTKRAKNRKNEIVSLLRYAEYLLVER